MKILMISVHDIIGGAAIAAMRQYNGIKSAGQDIVRLVAVKKGNDISTYCPIQGGIFSKIFSKLLVRIGLRNLSVNITNKKIVNGMLNITEEMKPDLINIHNIHGFSDEPLLIREIAGRIPVVWTLHDMWSFTGHCAYSYECDKFVSGCDESCPIPDVFPVMKPGRIRRSWLFRKTMFEEFENLVAVAPSRWLANEAKKGIWRENRVEVIPYGIDVTIFKPLNRSKSRQSLGLDSDMKYIIFGAYGMNEPRKGGSYLVESLNMIKDDNVSLLLFGSDSIPDVFSNIKIPIVNIGRIEDEHIMALAYCAADVFAMPSLADNFPNTILESMACGTPVVGFDVGGIPEMVRHMDTGYVANYKRVEDFAKGLNMILYDHELRRRLGKRCVDVVAKDYTIELMTKRYLALFEELAR